MNKAILIRNGERKVISFIAPKRISDLIRDLPQPCGGKGFCGKCRVRVQGKVSKPTEEERSRLSTALLNDGIRLACTATALGDVTIETDLPAHTNKAHADFEPIVRAPMGKQYGFAMDLGTTTLYAALYNLQTGQKCAEAAALNPQIRWGADVVSRMEQAIQGELPLLSRSIRNALFDLCAETLTKARLAPNDVDAAVLVGNTAMLYLLFAIDPTSIASAPFTCETRFGESVHIDFLPIDRSATLYVPRCISAFLGADTTAAAIACGLHEQTNVMLADLGTNGEMLLRSGENVIGCSCAAGPAFEGVGLECGMHAVDGAVCSVMLSGGRIIYKTHGSVAAKGVCGSGVIDWIACMLRNGDLKKDGLLNYGTRQYLNDTPIYLSQQDIRSFQLAKAAVRTGMEYLLRCAGTDVPDSIMLAGSFGNALRMKSACTVGLIPPQLAQRAVYAGNAAAKGAAMMLFDETLCDKASELSEQTKTLSLADQPDFEELLCRYMSF